MKTETGKCQQIVDIVIFAGCLCYFIGRTGIDKKKWEFFFAKTSLFFHWFFFIKLCLYSNELSREVRSFPNDLEILKKTIYFTFPSNRKANILWCVVWLHSKTTSPKLLTILFKPCNGATCFSLKEFFNVPQ